MESEIERDVKKPYAQLNDLLSSYGSQLPKWDNDWRLPYNELRRPNTITKKFYESIKLNKEVRENFISDVCNTIGADKILYDHNIFKIKWLNGKYVSFWQACMNCAKKNAKIGYPTILKGITDGTEILTNPDFHPHRGLSYSKFLVNGCPGITKNQSNLKLIDPTKCENKITSDTRIKF